MAGASKERIAKLSERKRNKSQPTEFRWRPHDGDSLPNCTMVRVGRLDWFGDQFEILSVANFNLLSNFCKQFSIPIEPWEDED